MATAVETVQTSITDIPLSRLRPASWNARKTFDEAALADLTASVKQHGIQTPLLVRPIGKKDDFEIVGGHRRHKAALAALLSSAPCIVRDMSDGEAREIGMIDNLQREGVPPLEEAKAFAELIKPKGQTLETVAAKIGKDPSYVARRLKLLNAIPPVQEALQNGVIEVGHALELARLDEQQQDRLFRWLDVVAQGCPVGFVSDDEDENDVDDDQDDDMPEGQKPTEIGVTWQPTRYSVAELRRQIARTMLRVLSEAPFPLEADIAPMPCTVCPKRSVNAAYLFADVAQDMCTDSECYQGKSRAYVRYSIEQAEEQGAPLILLGSQYYYDNKKIIQANNVVVVSEQKIVTPCGSQQDAIWFDGPKMGHTTLICRDTKCEIHYGFSSRVTGAPSSDKQKSDRKKTLAKLNVQKRYRKALFDALGTQKVIGTDSGLLGKLTTDIAEHCIKRMTGIYTRKLAEALGWDEKILGWQAKGDALRKHLEALAPTERMRAAFLAVHAGDLAVQEFSVNGQPKGLEQLAGYLGIDHNKLLADEQKRQAEKNAPKQAKPEPKPAPAKGKAAAKAPAKKKAVPKAAKTVAKKATKKSK